MSESNSNRSSSILEFDGEKTPHNSQDSNNKVTPTSSRASRSSTRFSRTNDLVRTLTGKSAAERELENADELERREIIGEHKQGINKILSKIQSRGGLPEEAIDVADVASAKFQPEIDDIAGYHPEDKWHYPLDKESGFRIVQFVDDDREDPRTWTMVQKWRITILLGIVCMVVAMASAIVTGSMEGPMETFHVSMEVVTLTVSLLVYGYGLGPLIASPLSEEYGRNAVYFPAMTIGTVFIVPCGAARNIGTLLSCRFLCGVFYAAPLCLIGGSLADMFRNKERGVSMAVFSAAPFLGPVIGPLIGGYIGDNAGWRWIYWVLLIIAGVIVGIMMLFLPETHHGTILKRRAKKLRKKTGDPTYRALCEIQVRTMKEILEAQLLRPLILLTEPIVFLLTMYMSIVYGILYMFFFAYPIIYGEGKHWSNSKVGLMFIPIGVGTIIGACLAKFVNDDYNRRAQPYFDKGELPPAELRLIPMMWSCWSLPLGLFPFAWSSFPHVHWAGPCISGLACGFGFLMLYNPANNYIVDTYQQYAASGLAAKTSVRSMWGASVPLFTLQMYHRMGMEWASTFIAFLSLLCCGIPFLFYFFGARIRKRSKYAFQPGMDS